MTAEQRLNAFEGLKQFLEAYLNDDKGYTLSDKFGDLDAKLHEAQLYNGWFTKENLLKSLSGITHLLNKTDLQKALAQGRDPLHPKTVAIIMAGNIPAVGFHDLLCVLLSGNKALIKLSSDDPILIPFLLEILVLIAPDFKEQMAYAENRLSNFDAVIATGSNNSSNYFETYFGKYPHIIRKNRNSVAVITGKETAEELAALGPDIFDYYGLGCRNVSKLYVPEGYVLDPFFESVFNFGYVIDNKKYANNYEYNRALYLMGQHKFLDNNFLVIKEDATQFTSPVGVLFYEQYKNTNELIANLKSNKEQIQCIASSIKLDGIETVEFGGTQSPGFFDYPDGVDVMEFLGKL
ncbi:MAG: acyl-CoA reductase [Bacteroidota bacterium]|nr:acyl-CoA reductase [Bacteroidota bacterium]